MHLSLCTIRQLLVKTSQKNLTMANEHKLLANTWVSTHVSTPMNTLHSSGVIVYCYES